MRTAKLLKLRRWYARKRPLPALTAAQIKRLAMGGAVKMEKRR